jgi:hypothetical protein
MKKRPNTSEVAPPSKKGPHVSVELLEPLDIASANTPRFNLGLYEKNPTRVLFKVARKGKNKLVSAVIETEQHLEERGALQSLPNSHENTIMELQGAC